MSMSWILDRAKTRSKYFEYTIIDTYKSIIRRAERDSGELYALTRTFPNNNSYKRQLEVTENRISHYNKRIDRAYDEISDYLDAMEEISFELNVLEGAI